MAKGNRFRLAFSALGSIWILVAAGMPVSAGESFFTHIHAEKAMANVTVSPGRTGPTEITIELETADEHPLKAKAVSVTLTSAKAGIKVQTIAATKTKESEWHVKASLPVRGRWMLRLGVLISDIEKVDVEAPILVK
ncbi:MAG TPA: FixH family protein [Bradyrhizobium sp.]|nr:FixH family protein [Bradyrhizobium sp.]